MAQIISFSKLLYLTVLSVSFILPSLAQTVSLNSGGQFEIDKNADAYFNLKDGLDNPEGEKQHIFDFELNDKAVAANFNMAVNYPDQYGIEQLVTIHVNNNKALTIKLNVVKVDPVLSGILIEN